MIRIIEFRGQRADTKEWVYGDLVRMPLDAGDYNNPPSQELKWFITDTHCLTHKWTEVIPETVGMFTGLLDKNNNKIFEGDKLEVLDENTLDETVYIGIMKWSTDKVAYRMEMLNCNYCNTDRRTLNIIGNVHVSKK